jgi:hypothetical protein
MLFRNLDEYFFKLFLARDLDVAAVSYLSCLMSLEAHNSLPEQKPDR